MQGKVALITGGTSGIGRATALAFARAGATVVICGRAVVELIKASNGEALFVKADVAKAAEVNALIAAAVATYGRLDFAVNHAGLGLFASTIDCTEKAWDLVFKVNVKGTWLCMKAEIPQMLKQGDGAIVNTSSIAGLVGIVGMPAYVASKHAILGLTKTAALEYASSNLRINAVCPGTIRTPMQDPVTHGDPAIEAQLGATHPLGRVGTAEEVAAAILWLCSDAASFVTGHALMVDGGYTAR
jgi:NAD(P)-dependent dehydrogenase (short-subunit alcohol dehydrogenase family)